MLHTALPVLLALTAAAPVLAQPDQPAPTAEPPAAPATTPTPPAPKGVLPIPDYTGCLLHRTVLLGDFGGERTRLAQKGVQFNIDWVQTVQGIVSGGRDQDTEYGGSLDYIATFDLDRMGLLPGAFVKMRAESRYGDSVNTISGSILAVNTDALFPLTTPADDEIPIAVTDLTYYQYLSEQFALFAGKIDTLDGDPNEFASGRGNSQFMNTQMIFSGTLNLLPYSTLGVGAIIMPTRTITISSVVANLTDSSTTSGFEDIGDGAMWSTEADFQYRLADLPGGTNVAFVYAWDTEFFDFNQRFTFAPGEGVTRPTADSTWIAYASGWQYLCAADAPAEGPLNTANGQPDLQGFGLFWRLSIADNDVNPSEWFASGGVGGKGVIPGRERDFFGVGFYYDSVQSGRLTQAIGLDDSTHGVECFYNIAVTPAAQLSFDAQFIDSAAANLDTAVVLGMRLKLEF